MDPPFPPYSTAQEARRDGAKLIGAHRVAARARLHALVAHDGLDPALVRADAERAVLVLARDGDGHGGDDSKSSYKYALNAVTFGRSP